MGEPLLALGFTEVEGEWDGWFTHLRYEKDWLRVQIELDYREYIADVFLLPAGGDATRLKGHYLHTIAIRTGLLDPPPPSKKPPERLPTGELNVAQDLRKAAELIPLLVRMLEMGPEILEKPSGA
ncbi:hypothetical protein EON79_06145 [bacterium]|nr:MAG: hypothetical protein EON79_06145 [bacterium]